VDRYFIDFFFWKQIIKESADIFVHLLLCIFRLLIRHHHRITDIYHVLWSRDNLNVFCFLGETIGKFVKTAIFNQFCDLIDIQIKFIYAEFMTH